MTQLAEVVHEQLFDKSSLSEAMLLSQDQVQSFFIDGRRSGPHLEMYCSNIFENMFMPEKDGHPYDLISEDESLKYEIRAVTKTVYFCPSSCMGSGRFFCEKKFFDKLDSITHYILADVNTFPKIKIYKVEKDIVRELYLNKQLGKTTKISYKKFKSLFT